MADAKIDLKNLKAGGFIKERGKDLFTVRLRVPGGRMSVDRLAKIAEVAKKYGQGFVHLSVRQSIELININFNNFDAVVAELGEEQQKVASCGARVRVPTACGGCEYNPNGLVDTQKSADEVDAKLFGTATGHHKFKVGFAGCPFDCPKSATNDIGFQGAIWPELSADDCISCGLCAKSCVEGAITIGGNGKPVFAADKCIYCGDCVKSCPTDAWKAAKRGYSVRIGGKWGRKPLVGTLYATLLPEDRVVEFISSVLTWYVEKAEGAGRVRLGDIILREGTDSLLTHLRQDFPEFVLDQTIPPQIIQTQLPLQKQEPTRNEDMERIDLRGVCCPTNFVKAKLELEDVQEGTVVEFLLDDGEPVKNVPRSLKAEGHKLLGLREADGYYVLTLEKVGE